MGGGSSTSRSGSAQKWARPFAIAGANDVQNVVNSNAGSLQDITNQVQGAIPDIYSKYQAGNPALNTATSYDVNLLNRDPYAGSAQLDNLINQTGQNVRNQVGADYGSRGAFGGTAWAEALTRGLAGNEAGLRYQDAQNIIGQQQAASANAPQKAAADYLGIQPFLQAAQTGAELPYTGINAQSGDLAQLFQGGKTKQSAPSPLGQILGAGAQAAATYFGGAKFSDRRLKRDIEKLGEFPDGLGIYEFAYKWEPEDRYLGVMADEIATLRPWALGPVVDGYATVNYEAL